MVKYAIISTMKIYQTFPNHGYMIASIIHEFVHLIYTKYVHGEKSVWLEEGLATYLSGQKSFLEQDMNRYNSFLERLFTKEIPSIDYLKKHGNDYGEFCDTKTEKYNGYDISYALIRYTIEKYGVIFLNDIIKSKYKLGQYDKRIISEFKQSRR